MTETVKQALTSHFSSWANSIKSLFKNQQTKLSEQYVSTGSNSSQPARKRTKIDGIRDTMLQILSGHNKTIIAEEQNIANLEAMLSAAKARLDIAITSRQKMNVAIDSLPE